MEFAEWNRQWKSLNRCVLRTIPQFESNRKREKLIFWSVQTSMWIHLWHVCLCANVQKSLWTQRVTQSIKSQEFQNRFVLSELDKVVSNHSFDFLRVIRLEQTNSEDYSKPKMWWSKACHEMFVWKSKLKYSKLCSLPSFFITGTIFKFRKMDAEHILPDSDDAYGIPEYVFQLKNFCVTRGAKRL